MRKRWAEASRKAAEAISSATKEEDFDDGLGIRESFSPSVSGMPASVVEVSSDDQSEHDEVTSKRIRLNVVDEDEAGDALGVAIGAVPSSASSGNALVSEAIKHTQFGQFTFPWERGPLAKIFSSKSSTDSLVPVLQPGRNNLVSLDLKIALESKAEPRISTIAAPSSSAIFEKVVKQTDLSDYVTQRFKQRQLALRSWWRLLSTNISASAFGQNILDEADHSSVNAYAIEVLDATFSVKSPGTLMKRYYALKSYFDFCENIASCEWAPLTETSAWKYAKHLKDINAPPTKLGSFIEAARFAWYVLGLKGADLVESSLRLKGLSAQMRVRKKPWRPAALLTISEVLKLHAGLEDTAMHMTVRIICGHMLHLLYGRSRWSDLLAVVEAFVDEDKSYFELGTQHHKGAKSAENKAKLLPIVAPCRGINGRDWVATYLHLRSSSGLVLPTSLPTAMLPAPMGGGGSHWRERCLTSDEGSEFLRNFLKAPKTESRRVSTHSMKSTAISWCSKAGLSEESRSLLARHASSVKNPVALYSRDLLSPVLREFDGVLEKICLKQFEPDRSRSGMLTPQIQGVAQPVTPFVRHPQRHDVEAVTSTIPVESQSERQTISPTECDLADNVSNYSVLGDLGLSPLEAADTDDVAGDDEQGASAAQRFLQSVDQEVLQADLVDEEWEGNFSDSSESASEESSSDEEQTEDLEVERGRNIVLQQFESASGFFSNNRTCVLHRKKSSMVFACGRKISAAYTAVHELNGLRCGQCFNI